MRHIALLRDAKSGYSAIVALWQQIRPHLEGGLRMEIEVRPERRNSEQNAAQWPILEAFSNQLKWPVNGHMVTMSDEEWKDVLSAAFKKEQIRLAMGLDGGVVMLGKRTSKFSKAEFSEWLDFLKSVAAERGVRLTAEEHAAA